MEFTVYEPNKYMKMGIKVWPQMVGELYASRELIWRLFIRDWSARYRQSALGYLWAVITPIIAIGTFLLLNRAGIFNIGSTDVPYPLFALIGLSVWQLFASGLTAGCNSIVTAGGMVSKINFPREVLVIASVAQVLFEFLIKFVLILVFFFVFRFAPPWWGIVLFPLAVLPIFALTLGMGLVFSLVNGVIRDTVNIVTLGTMFLMFLTPVLYPISGDKSIFFKVNPLYSLVNAPRELIMYGYIKEPASFIVMSVLSVLVLLISWRFFHLAETKIPERL